MPRLGAVANSADSSRCDAFWTAMNGGICSDSMGQYLRKDGTPVSFEELVAVGTGKSDSGPATFVVVGSAILLGLVLLKAYRS